MWSELYWPLIGGAEVFGSRLIAELGRRDREFLVVTSHQQEGLPDEETFDGVPVRRLPFRAVLGARDLGALVKTVQEAASIVEAFDPDLVHVNAIGPSGLFYLRVARRGAKRTPMLLTLQQELFARRGEGNGNLEVEMLRSADWVVGCSRAVLGQARDIVPEIEPRSSCIYNGVDLRRDESVPPPTSPRMLCLGRLVPQKGFDVAIDAFARVASRLPDARLVVAGDGSDRDALVARAAATGLDRRIDFLGWVDPAEIPPLIEGSTVVVMPSVREGLPVVAVQAALVGRPIIGTPVGGLPEVVVDGLNGIVVEPGSVESLAEAMVRIASDPATAMAMGRASFERARERFRWENVVAAYDGLYETLRRRSSYVRT